MCNRLKLLVSAAACAAALVPAAPTSARPPLSGLEQSGAKVDDGALADMRGKFIAPDNISYFGIEMQTSWQRPDGITTAATLLLSIDFTSGGSMGTPNVQLMVGWNHDGDARMDVAGFGPAAAGTYVTVPIAAGGLGSVQGAVQSQQIAGSDNQVANAMSIALLPPSAVTPPGTSGLTPATTGETHQFANGDSLQLVVDKNQMGIVMLGGADQVRQMVDGSIGQAAQNVLLNSNGNDVRNGMGITIGTSQLDQARQVSVQGNLEALKGWSF